MNNNKFEETTPYFVILDIKGDYELALKNTMISSGKFIGYLVNQTASNFYFEAQETKMLIIIPHSAIKFMAPFKKERV